MNRLHYPGSGFAWMNKPATRGGAQMEGLAPSFSEQFYFYVLFPSSNLWLN
jgi:hypothetical protein